MNERTTDGLLQSAFNIEIMVCFPLINENTQFHTKNFNMILLDF